MIERFYLKNFLSFAEAELEFQNGLIVFSGPSGSGKSILMDAILSSFGLSGCNAALCESSVTWEIDPAFGIENEEPNVFKQIKKEKTRYFVNAQSVAKRTIAKIASFHLRHLSLKDFSDFENENLLDIIDRRIAEHTPSIMHTKEKLQQTYKEYLQTHQTLLQIEDEERRIVELKEFANYEIDKIERINPKPNEYEELLTIKKELSKKEKILESIEKANALFDFEYIVTETLQLLEEESAFFDDAINELRSKLENATERFNALDEIDIEEVLNRLEQLSELKRKYGSIEEALAYLEKKKEELKKYENITFEKQTLQEKFDYLQKEIDYLCKDLTQIRKKELVSFKEELNGYTKQLYLNSVHVFLQEGKTGSSGRDVVTLSLEGVALEKISTGEFNRLRLAVLALKSEFLEKNSGVLILDEIDANLSGEESMSVAKVLLKLSKKYQIFVISHQPQLTSQGEQHFFVYKDEWGNSFVKELDKKERIKEIARIISGDTITKEALNFATELLKQ